MIRNGCFIHPSGLKQVISSKISKKSLRFGSLQINISLTCFRCPTSPGFRTRPRLTHLNEVALPLTKGEELQPLTRLGQMLEAFLASGSFSLFLVFCFFLIAFPSSVVNSCERIRICAVSIISSCRSTVKIFTFGVDGQLERLRQHASSASKTYATLWGELVRNQDPIPSS